MSGLSREVIIGFVEEAKSYLPIIIDNAKVFRKDGSNVEPMQEAYRYAHTIKGASSMIGLSALSHVAFYLEDVLDDIANGRLELDKDAWVYIRDGVNQIDRHLDGVIDGSGRDDAFLADATRSYNMLRGMPVDDATVSEIIAAVAADQPDDAGEVSLEELAPVDAPQSEIPATISFDDEFMAELREAFVEEAEDHLTSTARLLATLDKTPDDKDSLRELRRVVHTLKGAAATVGVNQIAEVSHRMEDLLDHLDEAGSNVTAPVMELLFDSADTMEDALQKDVPMERIGSLMVRYDSVDNKTGKIKSVVNTGEPVDILQFESVSKPQPTSIAVAPAAEREEAEKEKATRAKEQQATPARATSEVVRVPLERLDELTRLTSEFVITRTTLEQRINDLTKFINEIAPSLERLQRIAGRLDSDYLELAIGGTSGVGTAQVMAAGNGETPQSFVASEFDALEFDRYTELYMLSRELTETTSDIKTTHNDLRGLLSDFDQILTRQSRVSSEVQDKLMRTRMVPLSTIVTRLQRAVRVVARKSNKQVDLVIEGEHIELDKKVLEDIADPLLHLLRNSVDHGIEPGELRQVMGKPQRGTVRVKAYQEGNQIVMQIGDDGAGIDTEKVRAKAIALGYVNEAEAISISDDDLHQLIFMPGFSTADEVTETSGRGVGMDAVKAAVGRLKGTIHLATLPGSGTNFTIRLPLTLAVMRSLIVKARGTEYALPLTSVGQILRLEGSMMKQIGRNPVIKVGDEICPIVQLGEMLGMPAADLSERKRIPVLVVNADNQRVAVIVDEIMEGREIVIKTLGNHLRYVHGITGATLMGDGRVVLILNPIELVSEPTEREVRRWSQPPASADGAAAVRKRVLEIMVVDDSVSVRKVVANMVKNAGWNPIPARDGMEALEEIQTRTELPDAILLDIEMPRMNGYELTATLRANEAYRNIPIIMLTSRAGDKHRQKAYELGVNDYLVKPYREEDLLAAVQKVTK